MMDFNPIIPSENSNNSDNEKKTAISVPKERTDIIEAIKEPLSINNLVSTAKGHIIADEECNREYNAVKKELNSMIDKMSVKELLEYQKNLLKEREFHTECIFKALNFTIKTEYAKHLLVGTNKDDKNIRNITSRSEINSLVNLLKKK